MILRVVSTTHFASRRNAGAFTGPAMACSTRPSGAQKYEATLPPCFWVGPFGVWTTRNVPTF